MFEGYRRIETRRHIACCLLGAITVVALGAMADQNPEPWDLSISERLARRTAARQSKVHADSMGGKVQPGAALVIDGSRTPELFMPSELMAMLLGTYSLPSASRFAVRQRYHAAIVSFHWNEVEFWRDIDAAAADYFQAAHANQGKARSERASRAICAKRATALEQMRKRYVNFDRFLYGDFAAVQTLATSADQSEAWLAWMNGGCR
jgi:hypothetical protein